MRKLRDRGVSENLPKGAPGSSARWSPACQCRRHARLILAQHAMEQLSPCAATSEAVLTEPRSSNYWALAPKPVLTARSMK